MKTEGHIITDRQLEEYKRLKEEKERSSSSLLIDLEKTNFHHYGGLYTMRPILHISITESNISTNLQLVKDEIFKQTQKLVDDTKNTNNETKRLLIDIKQFINTLDNISFWRFSEQKKNIKKRYEEAYKNLP
ncbi:MAG: hypothetical protein ACOC1K_05560 [Nanoarchaeota archaeon]